MRRTSLFVLIFIAVLIFLIFHTINFFSNYSIFSNKIAYGVNDIVHGMTYKSYDEKGVLDHVLLASTFEHRAFDKKITLQDVELINAQDDSRVFADFAFTNEDLEAIRLEKNVLALSNKDGVETKMATDEAFIYPQQKIVSSEKLGQISRPGFLLKTDGFIANYNENKINFLANVWQKYEDAKGPILVKSQKALLNLNDSSMEYENNVEVSQNADQLKADKVKVFRNNDAKTGESKIKKIIADGQPAIYKTQDKQKSRLAKAQNMVLYPDKSKIILRKNVILKEKIFATGEEKNIETQELDYFYK